MRVLPLLAMLLAAVTACGAPAGSSGEIACTAIGTPVGIGINVSPHAGKADSATLVACWQAGCTTRTVRLYPASGAGTTTCTGGEPSDSCTVEQIPTGGKHGFAELPGLPASPVRVTLTLDGGRPQTLEVRPAFLYPNGPNCGGGGPQAQLIVGPDGVATEHE